MLLKDKLDHIFKTFGPHFNRTGKNLLKKLAKDEKKIDYNNLFFEMGHESVVKDVDFLNEIVTLYDLSIYFLDNSMRIVTSTEDQINFVKAITVLKKLSQAWKLTLQIKVKKKKNKIFSKQENVWSNVEMLLIKRRELLDQFTKNNIISRGEKIYQRKSEQKSD